MLPLIVGIAGGTGSGKTTLARAIVRDLPPDHAALIEHDWYYRDRSGLSVAERATVNFDEPAALENELLLTDLAALKAGRSVLCPRYDFQTHTRLPDRREIASHPIVIVEGVLLFSVPELVAMFDLRLYVDTDDDIRLLRRIRRDVEERGRDLASIEAQYLTTVRPMHALHVEPGRRLAHLVIPEGGENQQALDIIVGRLRQLLGQGS